MSKVTFLIYPSESRLLNCHNAWPRATADMLCFLSMKVCCVNWCVCVCVCVCVCESLADMRDMADLVQSTFFCFLMGNMFLISVLLLFCVYCSHAALFVDVLKASEGCLSSANPFLPGPGEMCSSRAVTTLLGLTGTVVFPYSARCHTNELPGITRRSHYYVHR